MYASKAGMNELSCSTVIVLPWARAGWAIDGASAAAAPPTTAVFRKSRRDALLIDVLPCCARPGFIRPDHRRQCLCRGIVLLLPAARKPLGRKPLDLAATS